MGLICAISSVSLVYQTPTSIPKCFSKAVLILSWDLKGRKSSGILLASGMAVSTERPHPFPYHLLMSHTSLRFIIYEKLHEASVAQGYFLLPFLYFWAALDKSGVPLNHCSFRIAKHITKHFWRVRNGGVWLSTGWKVADKAGGLQRIRWGKNHRTEKGAGTDAYSTPRQLHGAPEIDQGCVFTFVLLRGIALPLYAALFCISREWTNLNENIA